MSSKKKKKEIDNKYTLQRKVSKMLKQQQFLYSLWNFTTSREAAARLRQPQNVKESESQAFDIDVFAHTTSADSFTSFP